MKKIILLMAVFAVGLLLVTCSKEEVAGMGCNDAGRYSVTVISPTTRVLTDQVQGAGRYPDGETVSLYTSEQKFTAEARGSSGGTWATTSPQIRSTLTFGINQDWSVTIKDYYCDITLDNRAEGGDGTITTQTLKFGELLPTPVTADGYSFEGWYDDGAKITKVPECSRKTITSKFSKNVTIEYVNVSISFDDPWSGTVIIQCAAHTIGEGFFTGSSGSIKVEKGATINITIESELFESNVHIPSAGIDVIQFYPGGTLYDTNYFSFVANEDTNVKIHCYYGYTWNEKD